MLGIALICACLAYWGIGSSQGILFFQGREVVPLCLGYAAGGLVACAVIATELSKVRF